MLDRFKQKDLLKLRLMIFTLAALFFIVIGYLFYQLANQLVYETFYNVRVSSDVVRAKTSKKLESLLESIEGLPEDSFVYNQKNQVSSEKSTLLLGYSGTKGLTNDSVNILGRFQIIQGDQFQTPYAKGSLAAKNIRSILRENQLFSGEWKDVYANINQIKSKKKTQVQKRAPKKKSSKTKKARNGKVNQSLSKKYEKTKDGSKKTSVLSRGSLPGSSLLTDQLANTEVTLLKKQVLVVRTSRDGQSLRGILIDRSEFGRQLLGDHLSSLYMKSNLQVDLRVGGESIFEYEGARFQSFKGTKDLVGDYGFDKPFQGMRLIVVGYDLKSDQSSRFLYVLMSLMVALFGAVFWFLYSALKKRFALVQQQQNFLSAVSHELKTPLTSIRMYSEMLADGIGSESPGQRKKYYSYIHSESERLSRLIHNILMLTRSRSADEKIVLDLQACLLKEILAKAQRATKNLFDQSGFNCLWQIDPSISDDDSVSIDQDSFIQIMFNLLENAIKFSQNSCLENHGKKEVLVEVKKIPTDFSVCVVDYGAGIPVDEQRKIFDLFFRGGSELTRKTKGTGIGLHLVSRLASSMDIDLSLDSRSGETKFCLKLPNNI